MPAKGKVPATNRKLFTGPAGCGKSEKLFRLFEERLAAENPLEPLSYFVVPSHEHAERVIKLLITRGTTGFFSSRVTTLDELMEKTFQAPSPPVASSLTRISIVRRMITEDCGVYFEKVREKPGFLNLILSFLDELKESCWTPAMLREQMNRLKKLEPEAAAKYEALSGFYERYEKSLMELGLRDRRDTLSLYRLSSASLTQPQQFHTLCMDGFFDFTPLQRECLVELGKNTEHFFAALTWDTARTDVFETVTRTKTMFFELGFEIEAMGKDLPRFENDALAHVSQNLFCAAPKMIQSGEGWEAFEAPDPESEAEMIARRIVAQISGGETRPRDIAVLLRSVRPYRAVFEAVFRRFGIPFEIHERERLSDSEWIQTAARLVRVFREGWKKEDVTGFLQSAFVTCVGEEIKQPKALHDFEWICWKKGIRAGIESWNKAIETLDAEDAAAKSMRSWIELLKQSEAQWREAKTITEWTVFLKRLLYHRFGMLAFLKEGATGMDGREPAAPGRFEKILEEMERSSGAASEFDQFADDFLKLVDLDLFSLPHLNQNTVQVYDVSLARQKEYDVIFLAGLAEKQFPLQAREDALLSDWERRLMQGKPYPLPERKARQQLEKYLFYLAVTRARKHVCLSYARRDEEGNPVLPSFYFEAMDAVFMGGLKRQVKRDIQPYPAFDEITTRSDLRRAVAGAMFNPWENASTDEKILAQLARQAWPDAPSRAEWSKVLCELPAQITGAALKDKAFLLPEPSPTRIEAYARCPYRYYSEKILELQETQEDTRARIQGTIMHGVLEDYFKKAWKQIAFAESESWIEKSLDEWMKKEPLDEGPCGTAFARYEMKNILTRFIAFEVKRLESSAFVPRYFEWSVAPDEVKTVEIEWQGMKLNLKGYVDRLDVDTENKYALVTDYKRSRNFKEDALEDGTSLQLPLYLLAAKKMLGLEPAGGQLLNLKECRASGFYAEGSGAKKTRSAEEIEMILTRAMRYSKRFLGELAEGRVAVEPRDCMPQCAYSSVCRIEKWRLPEIAETIRGNDKKLGF